MRKRFGSVLEAVGLLDWPSHPASTAGCRISSNVEDNVQDTNPSNRPGHKARAAKPRRNHPVRPLALGVLLLTLLVSSVSASFAQPQDLGEISIYTLDNGDLNDSIGDAALKTNAATLQANEATPANAADIKLAPDQDGTANNAVTFDGTYYVQTQEESNIFPLTFSVWFKADNVTDEHSIVDSDIGGEYGFSLIIGYDDPQRTDDTPRDGSLTVQYHDGVWDSNVKIEQGKWYQAYVTYSQDTITLFLGAKGEQLQEISTPYTLGNLGSASGTKPTFRFGRHNPGDPQWFVGDIGEVRFYNKTLSITEVVEEAKKEDPSIDTTQVENTIPTPAPSPVPPTSAPAVTTNDVGGGNGDVHILTVDRLRYDFQEVGDFVVMSSTTGGLMVQARQEAVPNSSASVNTAAAMQVGPDKLEFYLNKGQPITFTINDQPAALPTGQTPLPGGGTITPYGSNGVDIFWPDGNTIGRVVFWSDCIDIFTGRLTQALQYEGVYGNKDGDPNNDIKLRAGDVITPPASAQQIKEFGDSWRVREGESLFDAPLSVEPPAEAAPTLADIDPAKREEAKATCDNAGITNEHALYSCTYDVAVTDNLSFVDSAKGVDEMLAQATPVEIVAGSDAPGLEIITDAPAVEATTAPVTEATTAPVVEATTAPVAEATTAPVAAATNTGFMGFLQNPIITAVLGFLVGILMCMIIRRR